MVQRSSTITTGVGSGRVSILGRSFIRCEEEKETGGGGGGTAATTTTTDTSAGTKPEKTYTAAEVENIVKDRLARAKPKEPEPGKKPTGKAENVDPMWGFDLMDAIDAHTKERAVEVPQGLKKRMRSAFLVDRPDDPHAWVGSWLDDAGLVKKAADTTTTDKAAAEKKTTDVQTGKPISDKGTATVTKDVDDIDPRDLTAVDVERIHEKHGVEKGNDLISKKVTAWLQTVKIVPERGPRR